ncbi:hypothetical protein [Calothrix sp. NIES-3974]|uniref:hypothetical protein n=1 Tax=Calothrix sp. NIES-3974 TaxID=2005462 RepID=UPI0012FE2CA0|nr:hypothetical protein [Calothrix sp. NIES-3974]
MILIYCSFPGRGLVIFTCLGMSNRVTVNHQRSTANHQTTFATNHRFHVHEQLYLSSHWCLWTDKPYLMGFSKFTFGFIVCAIATYIRCLLD